MRLHEELAYLIRDEAYPEFKHAPPPQWATRAAFAVLDRLLPRPAPRPPNEARMRLAEALHADCDADWEVNGVVPFDVRHGVERHLPMADRALAADPTLVASPTELSWLTVETEFVWTPPECTHRRISYCEVNCIDCGRTLDRRTLGDKVPQVTHPAHNPGPGRAIPEWLHDVLHSIKAAASMAMDDPEEWPNALRDIKGWAEEACQHTDADGDVCGYTHRERGLAAFDHERKALRDALTAYGHHADDCEYALTVCTCGFTEAMRTLFEKEDAG